MSIFINNYGGLDEYELKTRRNRPIRLAASSKYFRGQTVRSDRRLQSDLLGIFQIKIITSMSFFAP